jgi:hypothetical protein
VFCRKGSNYDGAPGFGIGAEKRPIPTVPNRHNGGKTYDITEKDRPLLLVGKRTVIIGLRVPETDPYFERYEVVSSVRMGSRVEGGK